MYGNATKTWIVKKINYLIVSVLVAVLVAAWFVGKSVTKSASMMTTETTVVETTAEKTTKKEEATTKAKKEIELNALRPYLDDGLINILLIGQDRREGEGRQRSDSMIVCSINVKTKQVSLISFLRDLYVEIPGNGSNRLNAAYVFGGFDLLKETLMRNFDVAVDGCVEVDFDGFREVVDQIGGLDIELSEAEAKQVGSGAQEGMNHLTGKQALRYARIRKIDNDFERTNRQRTVILTAYEKLKDSSLKNMIAAIKAALPYVTTDLSSVDIVTLATTLFPLLNKVEINSYQIPADGTFYNTYVNGMAVLMPDKDAIRDILFSEYLPY